MQCTVIQASVCLMPTRFQIMKCLFQCCLYADDKTSTSSHDVVTFDTKQGIENFAKMAFSVFLTKQIDCNPHFLDKNCLVYCSLPFLKVCLSIFETLCISLIYCVTPIRKILGRVAVFQSLNKRTSPSIGVGLRHLALSLKVFPFCLHIYL